MVSYLLPVLLICVYMATSMGIGVHTCSTEGSLQVKLLAGEEVCNHHHDQECDHEHKACGCDAHDSRCCHTLVYRLDKDQDVVTKIEIDISKLSLGIALYTPFSNPSVCSHQTTPLHSIADIVCGPGGGQLTPLRL